MLAVDFFAVETIGSNALRALSSNWAAAASISRAARQSDCALSHNRLGTDLTLTERPGEFRFLIRDRDQKFNDSVDEVFRSVGIEILRTPFRAPQANGVAERFVRTIRSECLDWLLIMDQRHLERCLAVFVDHYNGHRPHRALALNPPQPTSPPLATGLEDEVHVQRRDRLGGVVREYTRAA